MENKNLTKCLKIFLMFILFGLILYFIYIFRELYWYEHWYLSLLILLIIIFIVILFKIKKTKLDKKQKILRVTSIVLAILICLFGLIYCGGLSSFGIIIFDGDICKKVEENNYRCCNLPSMFCYGWGFIPEYWTDMDINFGGKH